MFEVVVSPVIIRSLVVKVYESCVNLQDLDRLRAEGEPRVSTVVRHSERVIPNTASHGKEVLLRDVDSLRNNWESFLTSLQQVSTWVFKPGAFTR